ncbi:hypothetical protein [Vibrio harveyi]|uniref:hypothetical protein n=1 Tax=Vibrio harveyi TaxID=669 RepID=UPI003D714859
MNRRVFEYQGARGIPAIAEKVGIPKTTLKHRIHKLGMTLEEAIAVKGEKKVPAKHEYQGIRGLRAIAEAFGMSQKALENRVITKKMSIEEAISKPVKRHNGECFVEQRNIAADKERYLWNLALGIGGF